MDLLHRFKNVFSCDLRSLVILRAAMGAYVMVDVLCRALYLTKHYTDEGILDRTLVGALLDVQGLWSIHNLSGAYWYQAFLFTLTFAVGATLAAGFWTKTSLVLAYVLSFSMQNKFPISAYPGDFMLRVVMMIGLFLPLGEFWSWDSRGRKPRAMLVFNSGTVVLTAFVTVFMVFTAITKTGQSWKDGTAVYLVLNNVADKRQTYDFLLDHLWLTKILTYSTVIGEFFGGLLIMMPFFFGPVRAATTLGLASLLCGFGIGVDVWLFPFLMASAVLSLLPSWFWDKGWQKHAPVREADPRLEKTAGSRLAWALGLLLGLVLLTDHVRKFGEAGYYDASFLKFPAPVFTLVNTLGIRNEYAMYRAPENKPNGFEIISGAAGDRWYNLVTGDELKFEVPADAKDNIGSFRDKRMFQFLSWKVPGFTLNWDQYNQDVMTSIAKYYCKQRPARGPASPVDRIQFWKAQYKSLLPPERRSELEKEMMLEVPCETALGYRFTPR